MTKLIASVLLCTFAGAVAAQTEGAPTEVGVPPQPAAPDTVITDVYSHGVDTPFAYVDDQPLYWSDFGRWMIRAWGTTQAHAHFAQLTYTEILRQKLAELELMVTRAEMDREMLRAWNNSRRGDPTMRTAADLGEFFRRIESQYGKPQLAYERYCWGYAAQSIIIDHLHPEEERRGIYDRAEDPAYRQGFVVCHILAQTLAGKRSPEEARARAKEAHARLEAGEDWNLICWLYSDDTQSLSSLTGQPTAVTLDAEGRPVTAIGGLPQFKVGQCPFGETMTQAAAAVKDINGISEVFESDWGFHILKLVNRTEALSYEEASPRIHGMLSADFMRASRAAADIKLHVFQGQSWRLRLFEHADVVMAEVNGRPLYLSDFGRLLYTNVGPRDGSSYLKRCIEEYCLRLAGKELGVSVSTQEVELSLQLQFDQARASGRIADTATLEDWLSLRGARANSSPAQLRQHQEETLYLEKTRQALSSDELCQAYYDAHSERFTPTYHVRAIFIYYFKGERTRAEARALAEKVLDKLVRVRDTLPLERLAHADEDYFGLLVERYSEDPISGRRQGAMQPWRPGVGPRPGNSGKGKPFEDAVEAAGKQGAGVVDVQGGSVVFEVTQVEPALSFAEARSDIGQTLRELAPGEQAKRRKIRRVEPLLQERE